jgi:ribose transport system ATP-binding protein
MLTFDEVPFAEEQLSRDPPRKLRAVGLRKSFGSIEVLHGVDLDLMAGEVHALLGENGAGKSTIINMLSGRTSVDAGEIELDQKVATFSNPLAAKRAGISIIAQELELVPTLSVLENIFLGKEPTKFGIIRWGAARKKVSAILSELGIGADPAQLARTLSIADQQLVEIAKAIIDDFRVLIMDEPTSALSLEETARLFKVISRLKADGVAILYVSHRLWEVFRIADRVTVLRDGHVAQKSLIKRTDTSSVIQSMLGPKSSLISGASPRTITRGALTEKPILDVRNLSSGDLLRSISLTVKSGEVIGLAGVLGSGRNELCEALYGLRQISPDTTIQLNAQRAQFDEPKKASRHGIFLLSEDRKQEGIFPGLDLRENTILRTMVGRRSSARSARPRNTGLMEITGFGVVSTRSELIAFDEMRRSLNIKCSGPESRITHLSGGNQQKILFARGRISKPFLMILSEPTRGVDIGAKEEIYSAIDQLASEGTGLIVSSSEIPELLRLCTRILVLRHGEVVAEVLSLQANEESILKIMAG